MAPALIIGGLFLIYFLFFRKTPVRLLGPTGLPFIGNVLQIPPQFAHQKLSDWAYQYGGLYKIKMFGEEIIIASSEESIKEVLGSKSEDFAGRPHSFRVEYLLQDQIAFKSPSPRWRLLKKQAMRSLKVTGTNADQFETITAQVCGDLLEKITATKGEAFNPRAMIHEFICATNSAVVYGYQLSPEELQQFTYMDRLGDELLSIAEGSELDTYPWLRFLPNKIFERMQKEKPHVDQAYRGPVKKVCESIKNGEESPCVIADLMQLMEEKHDANRGLNETKKDDHAVGEKDYEINMQHLVGTGAILMQAGNITSVVALLSLIAILANDLDLQRRCQDEVSKVIGQRSPTLADRASLSFVESLLLELMRLTSNTPLAVPHMSVKDTDIQGIPVPKDTQVWVNLWHLHHDPTLWDDPWTFLPDRFLDAEGNLLKGDSPLRQNLLPWSAGVRSCPGEVLSRHKLFLTITKLLQSFTFLPAAGNEPLPHDPRGHKLYISTWPDEFSVKAEPRYH